MKLLNFLVYAVLSQGVGAITGLLLARWLDVGDYAIYTVVGIIMGAIAVVTKGGIQLGLNALLGKTWPDRQRAAELARAAMGQRWKLSAWLLPVVLAIAAWLLHRNHAGMVLTALLLALLLATWYFDMQSRVVDQVLLFANRAPALQALDTALSVARLVLSSALYALGMLGVLGATLVNVLCAGLRVPVVRRWIAREIPGAGATLPGAGLSHAEHGARAAADRQFIGSVMRRQLPLEAFYCIQGQMVFAIVAFHGAVGQTAALGALSRIGQLLMPVGAVVAAYVIPRFAQAREGVLRRFAAWVALACLPAAALVLLAILWPGLLLWLVGPNYAALHAELVVACLGSGFASVVGIAWQLLANRGLNHFAFVQVPVVAAWCALAPRLLDLTTLDGVLWFQLGLSSGLAAAIVCEIAGAVRAGRLLPADEQLAANGGSAP
ncbi:hypothetical protein AB4Z48_00010 [Cupriavidus sp. 2TAF22]|uniref:hypothetical protein n=1 Tax=unclassified Cupriavidus TaxID=2640874 RepID=UPI003F914DDD